jgi:putative Mn2+ efflux pump MntP
VILALILIVIGTLMIINQFRKSGAAGKSADRDQKSE